MREGQSGGLEIEHRRKEIMVITSAFATRRPPVPAVAVRSTLFAIVIMSNPG
jgi:hypothetical protein